MVMSSVAGKDPDHKLGVYGMTKATLNTMVYALSKELRADGVRVNGIAPGLIRTTLSEPLFGAVQPEPSMVGEIEDIGATAALMCSPVDGSFINGEIFTVHGGYPKL